MLKNFTMLIWWPESNLLDSLKKSGHCCQEYYKFSDIQQEKYFQFFPGVLHIFSVK